MGTKNFRAYYKYNGQHYHTDFSMDGAINNDTKISSALSQIIKSHPNIKTDEISIYKIEDLVVW